MVVTAEMLARLEAQRAHFASDDLIRERAGVWRDATAAECLAAVDESCEEAAALLSRLDPDALERALAPEPLPDHTIALLLDLWRSRRP